jgi:hypothetical protein
MLTSLRGLQYRHRPRRSSASITDLWQQRTPPTGMMPRALAATAVAAVASLIAGGWWQ